MLRVVRDLIRDLLRDPRRAFKGVHSFIQIVCRDLLRRVSLGLLRTLLLTRAQSRGGADLSRNRRCSCPFPKLQGGRCGVKDQHPAEGIVATAKEKGCDLIVMASHGRRGLSRLLLGSQAYEVLTHCSVPALIVR